MHTIKRTGDAIGDHCMTAFFVQLLNDNGIKATYGATHYRDLFDIPVNDYGFEFTFDYSANNNPRNPTFDKNRTILEITLDKFKTYFPDLKDTEFKIKTPYVPVKYKDNPDIKSYDIVMATKSGVWSRYRNWLYFPELKKVLDKEGITYYDLSENNIKNNDCLNYVKKSKLYIGLETGTSHYVSQFANNKGLIIQSGYCDISYWCNYKYEIISRNVNCKPCFLNLKTQPCTNGHICMKNITVDMVMEKIKEMLNERNK